MLLKIISVVLLRNEDNLIFKKEGKMYTRIYQIV